MQQKELLVYAKALFYLNQIYIPFASRKSLIRFVQALLKYSAETLPRMGLISLLVAGEVFLLGVFASTMVFHRSIASISDRTSVTSITAPKTAVHARMVPPSIYMTPASATRAIVSALHAPIFFTLHIPKRDTGDF